MPKLSLIWAPGPKSKLALCHKATSPSFLKHPPLSGKTTCPRLILCFPCPALEPASSPQCSSSCRGKLYLEAGTWLLGVLSVLEGLLVQGPPCDRWEQGRPFPPKLTDAFPELRCTVARDSPSLHPACWDSSSWPPCPHMSCPSPTVRRLASTAFNRGTCAMGAPSAPSLSPRPLTTVASARFLHPGAPLSLSHE